jgi:hypothetical protein
VRLLNLDQPVLGISRGKVHPELSAVAIASRGSGGSLNPDAGDLDVTTGWGHFGLGTAVMPGKGKVARGLSKEHAFELWAYARSMFN